MLSILLFYKHVRNRLKEAYPLIVIKSLRTGMTVKYHNERALEQSLVPTQSTTRRCFLTPGILPPTQTS